MTEPDHPNRSRFDSERKLTVRTNVAEEIREVQDLYASIFDTRQWNRLGAVFTADAVFGPGDGATYRGLAEIENACRSAAETFSKTRHFIASHAVSVGNDRADASCAFLVGLRDAAAQRTTTMWGEYIDVFSWTADGWRISGRQAVVDWVDVQGL